MSFFPGKLRARGRALVIAMAAAALPASGAFAADDGLPTAQPADAPITVYTGDAEAFRPGGSAAELLELAREQRRIRVIVGLRLVTRMEHTLSEAQIVGQRQAQRRVEDAIVARVLGSASAPGVDRFEFIPFISMFVTAAQLERLLADPGVASIEKDVELQVQLTESIPVIHADDVFAKGFNGTGYTVAVIDTGVAKTHAMFVDKVVSEACYSTHYPPQYTSGCPGNSAAVAGPGTGVNCLATVPGCDHGTHVAAIAAGNSNIFDGVGRDATIIAIKVATIKNSGCGTVAPPCQTIFTNDWVKGLNRVYGLRKLFKIASVNLSLGGTLYSAACDGVSPSATTIFHALRAAGIAPIVSSGNQSSNDKVGFPSCISHVIAVGNTAKTDPWTDLVYTDSNHSPLVQLLAPGTAIRSAVPLGSTCIKNNDPHCSKTGTSMAAPHVAGAFAILKNAFPAATVAQILDALKCSGKMVDHRFVNRARVELDPARPRIDLLGAYNRLRGKPPNVSRIWNFDAADEAKDWTPFRGKWVVQAGKYSQAPLLMGYVASSVASCDTHLVVDAKVRLTGSTYDGRFGILIKSQLNHTAETVSGYYLVIDKSPPGTAHIERWDNWSLEGGGGATPLLCNGTTIPLNVEGFSTIRAISRGAQHSFYLNGRLVCTVNDATYPSGAVVVLGYNMFGSYQLAVDSLQITSIAAGASPGAEAAVMKPAAYGPQPLPSGTKAVVADNVR